MELVADIFLAAGALGAGFYCFVLGRRLNRFNNLEKGVGGAVAVLSSQVDDLGKTLEAAQKTASDSAETLNDITQRATEVARKLELQMASFHDVPEQPSYRQNPTPHVDEAKAPEPSEPMFMRRSGGGGR
ncbi:MAG: hypothetical protein AAFQ58_07835 [Pseudomonadota bacterium]